MIFKVPMLRNVTLTAPYFHDGQVSTLPEAVRLMAWMQLDKRLNSREINDIVHFLHALDVERHGKFED
jgi:cytochrome c peroxidase